MDEHKLEVALDALQSIIDLTRQTVPAPYGSVEWCEQLIKEEDEIRQIAIDTWNRLKSK